MDSITQIKSKLDIVDVVSQYISLKKSGRNYTANCPFHGEKTPSFMVSQDLQIYKCFGCGESGDMFNFVQQIEGIDFVQALDILAEKAGVKIEKGNYDKNQLKKKILFEINQVATHFYHHLLYHKVGTGALNYLKQKRGLTDDTIKLFKLGYSPNDYTTLINFLTKKGYKTNDIFDSGLIIQSYNSNGYIDKFRNRLMFPFIDNAQKTVGFTARSLDGKDPKYLNTPETIIFHKQNYLYGLDKAKVNIKTQGSVFVEGQMDLISAYQAGFKNVVASSGTAITTNQLKLLKRYSNEITFCLDSDNAGINAVYKGVELAEKQDFNIKVANIPKQFKDIDELIKNDRTLADQVIHNAVSAYDFFLSDKLNKYNKDSAYGKKKIIEELKPLLEKISNKVLFESYLKELHNHLDIDFLTLKQIITNKKDIQSIQTTTSQDTKNNTNVDLEVYFLSLLIKAQIDFIKSYLYNIDLEDWKNKDVAIILQNLVLFTNTNQIFEINKFIETLTENHKDFIKNLYIQDIEFNQKEFDLTLNRIRKIGGKEKINRLTKNIKLAEKQGDYLKVQTLLKEIENTKQVLLQ